MIIALTVGLSLISRSITSVKTSTEEANSQKALSAAEAGIEQSIKSNQPIAKQNFGSDSEIETSITQVLGTNFLVNGGEDIRRDDSADVWLSEYSTDFAGLYSNPTSPRLSVYFGTSTTECENPAIVIDIISGSKANPVLDKYSFDPCSERRDSNSFQTPASELNVLGEVSFRYRTPEISITNGLFMKITSVYEDSVLGINSNIALPPQGTVISSTGTTGSTVRKITVFQGFPKIPAEFFPYSLFSP